MTTLNQFPENGKGIVLTLLSLMT